MIELNSKTKQDFLNREWVQKLLDAGVDMSDAKYQIGKRHADGVDLIWYAGKNDLMPNFVEGFKMNDIIPTYTVSELLYKLHEWICPTINGVKYSGVLCLWKDAPFYPAQYRLQDKDGKCNENIFFCPREYPIESLASLLIQCHKHDIGMKTKDTGDIRDK